RAAEALAEEYIADDHVEHRIDVVAERRLGGSPVLDRPHIDAPVEDDQEARDGEKHDRSPVGEDAPGGAKLPKHDEHRGGHRKRPQAAMNGDLDRRNMADEAEIEGHAAPDEVGKQAIENPLLGLAQVAAI